MSPFIMEYACLKLLMKKPYKPISKPFETNETNKLNHVYFKLNLNKKPQNIKSRTYILWNVMQLLNSVYKKDYNIMIPMAFKNIKNINNNVGVMFVKYPKENMTLEALDKQINKNKYSLIATNLLLRGLTGSSHGKNGRKSMDMVFTSGYIKDHQVPVTRNIVTFNTIADYGIYCLTTTLNKTTHITLTFSTNEIDKTKFEMLNNIL